MGFTLILPLLSILAVTTTFASSVSTPSITSPTVCLTNLECPAGKSCNTTISFQISRCAPRLPKNATCSQAFGADDCANGLTCEFPDEDSFTPICLPRRPRGADCRLGTSLCQPDLICEQNTTTCQPFTTGFAGAPCQFDDSKCQQDKGFYCKTRPGVCAPKRRQGAVCDLAADNFECLGFCATSPRALGTKCVNARNEGDLCTEDRECDNPFIDLNDPNADNLICNSPKDAIGRCVRTSNLLIRLGARCNPAQDRCDARRALICLPLDGGHVCQHRRSRFNGRSQLFEEFCEPRSRLSRCAQRDERTECRLERRVPGKDLPVGIEPNPFFRCLRKAEKVAHGGICLAEYAACESGTACRVIPGVRRRPSPPFTRVLSPLIPFCVRLVKQGGSCGDVTDKFTTQCDAGLRCEKGTCIKAGEDEPPFDDKVTHAGIDARCAELPCAPGLVCEKEESGAVKRCMLPLRTVGKGVECTDRATERRQCAKSLVCLLRKDGTDVRRCRPPQKAGDFCKRDDDCPEGLMCPFFWTGDREQEERRCYKPDEALRLGQRCDPKASGSQPRCVTTELPDEFAAGDTVTVPMRCLGKGNGFVCRVVVGLFSLCDEAGDIGCDTGLKCSSFGVCIPVGEE